MWTAIATILAALVSGGIGIWSAYQNKNANEQILGKEQDFTRQMNAIQTEQGIQQWNRENEYNSIQSQIQRFSAAGLNPDLIYGQATSGTGSASLPTSAASPEGGFGSLSGLGPSVQTAIRDAVAIQNQTDLVQSQSDMYRSQADYYDYLSGGKGGVDASVADANKASADYRRRLTKSQDILDSLNIAKTNETNQRISNLLGEFNNIALRGKALNEDFIAKRIDNLYRDEHWQKQLRLLESEIGVNKAQQAYFEQQTKELLQTFAYRLNMIRNDSEKSDSEKEDAASRALLDMLQATQQLGMFFTSDEDGNYSPNLWNYILTYGSQITGMLGNVMGGNFQIFSNISHPTSSRTTTKYGMGEDGHLHPTSQTTTKTRKIFK